MRHGRRFNHLSRKCGHRRALLRNLAISLIKNKRIVTTLAKGRALKKFIEPVLTESKDNSMNSRRLVFSKLVNKDAVKELFNNVSGYIMNRNGGYTRIIKLSSRFGDNAKMCSIDLIDFSDDKRNR